jgi:hypothetical protein
MAAYKMADPPRTSFPSAPSEPNLRRLGVGNGGGGERPLRAQLVVALVAGLILIAVPLYLWRRPAGSEHAGTDAGAATSANPALEAGVIATTPVDAGRREERVKLGTAQRVRCSAGPGASGQEGSLCDNLGLLEQALSRAVMENVGCAPRGPKEGSINYVLTVDFAQRKLHVFPGASGSWKGPQARRATQCVKKALSAPGWESLKHQYRYYQIAVLATYAPEEPAVAGPSFE